MNKVLAKALMDVLQEEIAGRAVEKIERAEPLGAWCRADAATRYFGIPEGRLRGLVSAGKVTAKKFDMDNPRSAVVYRTADIETAIENMPNYTFA